MSIVSVPGGRTSRASGGVAASSRQQVSDRADALFVRLSDSSISPNLSTPRTKSERRPTSVIAPVGTDKPDKLTGSEVGAARGFRLPTLETLNLDKGTYLHS